MAHGTLFNTCRGGDISWRGKRSLKKKIRRLLLNLFKSAGIFDVWRYQHRKGIVILMLHGTADPNRPSRWTPLRPQFSPDYIDWCMREISKYYRFISLEEAIDILTGKMPPVENGITITMDDGYRSNLADALPVLKKYNAPVTIFLPVTNIEKRVPMWFDRLDYVLQSSDLGGNSFQIGDTIFGFSADGRDGLAASYSKFRELIKETYTDEEEFHSKMEEVITYFERRSGKSLGNLFEDDPWSALLRWEEIKGYQGEYVQFGSHTMDHCRVSGLKEDPLRYQLFESKRIIKEKTGNPCKYIAYPNGDCSESAIKIALEAGYEAGVTTNEGINETGCDRMTLKRISLPWTSDKAELLAYVSGFSDALSYHRWAHRRNAPKLKIAILTSFPADPESPKGGVEAVSVNLCRALAEFDDLEIHVVTFLPGATGRGRTHPGAPECASASRGIGFPAPITRSVPGGGG